jgi:hypothetical protein
LRNWLVPLCAIGAVAYLSQSNLVHLMPVLMDA